MNCLYDLLQGVGMAFLIFVCGGLYLLFKVLMDKDK
jgi:hypothetical protein